MRAGIIGTVLFFILSTNAKAQVIHHVAPGQGTLASAIQSAAPNDILELLSGRKYTVASGASGFGVLGFPLTIKVEDNATEKAVLCLEDDVDPSKKYYFFEVNDGAALTLEGLDIHGISGGEAVAASMLIFDARPTPSEAKIGNFHFKDCIFHDFTDYIIHGMKDDYARGLIQDSVFIDQVTVYNANHFLQYKHVSLHHLEMTNSTIYNLNGMALKIGKIGYRCVLEHPEKPYIPISPETITPTGFIDHCTLNNLGDIHGHIQIDNSYHPLTISNCIISHQQQYNQPAVYLFEPMCDTAVIIENTCFWDVTPPNDELGTEWISYVFKDSMTYNPYYNNAVEGDFSLPYNSPLLTASTDGGQIGDLRWGVYDATGIKENMPGSTENILEQSFPNPFHGSTEINFHLVSASSVNIRIYSIIGVEVESLANSVFPEGDHKVYWNAGKNKAGIYFCKMETGSYTKTIQLVLK
ncbi:MAG: DUF5123 domain-containing protein [Bacteroidales bacterium]|nr:DUF5123 domain-containing protein [Bacteroidales bacterium]MCF8390122.1 DUF5123 domain-containing protein [Bacteroidales bacterium]